MAIVSKIPMTLVHSSELPRYLPELDLSYIVSGNLFNLVTPVGWRVNRDDVGYFLEIIDNINTPPASELLIVYDYSRSIIAEETYLSNYPPLVEFSYFDCSYPLSITLSRAVDLECGDFVNINSLLKTGYLFITSYNDENELAYALGLLISGFFVLDYKIKGGKKKWFCLLAYVTVRNEPWYASAEGSCYNDVFCSASGAYCPFYSYRYHTSCNYSFSYFLKQYFGYFKCGGILDIFKIQSSESIYIAFIRDIILIEFIDNGLNLQSGDVFLHILTPSGCRPVYAYVNQMSQEIGTYCWNYIGECLIPSAESSGCIYDLNPMFEIHNAYSSRTFTFRITQLNFSFIAN